MHRSENLKLLFVVSDSAAVVVIQLMIFSVDICCGYLLVDIAVIVVVIQLMIFAAFSSSTQCFVNFEV